MAERTFTAKPESGLRPWVQPKSALRIGAAGDAYEREADRAADAVMGGRGLSSAGASLSRIPVTQVQREEGDKPKSDADKYKEAAQKLSEAFPKTVLGKMIKERLEQGPLVKDVKEVGESFIGTLPGKIITGAAATGAVAALAAMHKELPIQIPEIPLDKITPGLSVQITYEGPVDNPSKAMITFSYTEQVAKKKEPAKTKSEIQREENARMAADMAKFRAGMRYMPGSPEAKQQEEEEAMFKRAASSRLGKLPFEKPEMFPGLATTPSALPLTFPTPSYGYKPKPFSLMDDELKLKPKAEAGDVKEPKKKEEGTVQRKAAPGAAPASAPSQVHEVLASPGHPLDAATRGFMETRFGHDFGHVRIHADQRAANSARSIDALAYTAGSDIVFAGGAYNPHSGAGKHLLAHELAHVVQQNAQPGCSPSLQRKVVLGGKAMTDTERKLFIKNRKWANGALAASILQDMQDAGDDFDFASPDELQTEITKRISTAEHMKESQVVTEKVPGDKRTAFGYPFTGESVLYGPRVNYAAREYWKPLPPDNYAPRTDKAKNKELLAKPRGERCQVYGDMCGVYSWNLSDKGKADPHKAIAYLFAPQQPYRRTLIHCDYLISLVQFLSLADAIGPSEFNKGVKAYGVDKIILRWNAFNDLQDEFSIITGAGELKYKGMGSLQRVVPSSEQDLVIGDHAIFFNHIAYDLLNRRIGNAWRLENAVLIGKTGKGADIFLGHGSGRKTADEMRAKLAEEYNDVAKIALGVTARAQSKSAKTRNAALTELTTKFPALEEVSGKWRLRGTITTLIIEGCSVPVDQELRAIKGSEVIGLRDPRDTKKMYPVRRPIESAK
ncbi:hypothetical protein BURK2_00192 [Burkholderiales bacterium]|nr:hypothetical protein BURK2_00192 [Burkholderiales bacterium]